MSINLINIESSLHFIFSMFNSNGVLGLVSYNRVSKNANSPLGNNNIA